MNKEDKIEMLSFKKTNYYNMLPDDFKELFLELDNNISDNLFKKLKDCLFELNDSDNDKYSVMETLIIFVNHKARYCNDFEKIDFTKVTPFNLQNITSLNEELYKKIKNFEPLYEHDYNSNYSEDLLTYLSEIGSKNVQNVLDAVFSYGNNYAIGSKLFLLISLEKDGFDTSILNSLEKEKINKIMADLDKEIIEKIDERFIESVPNDFPEFTIRAIDKKIDYRYILKNSEELIPDYLELLKKDIDINDFYKNGYNNATLQALIRLRSEDDLKIYESEVIKFYEYEKHSEDHNQFFLNFLETKPTSKEISLFKDFMKRNDNFTISKLVKLFELRKKIHFEYPEKIFALNERVVNLEELYNNWTIKEDITKYDIENKSKYFFEAVGPAHLQDFTLEEIFSDVNGHEDNLLIALNLKRMGIALPKDADEMFDLYFKESNREYEVLHRLYHKGISGVHVDFDFFKKLEYLIEYNKTHEPVLIEDYINTKLDDIKEMLEGEER